MINKILFRRSCTRNVYHNCVVENLRCVFNNDLFDIFRKFKTGVISEERVGNAYRQ